MSFRNKESRSTKQWSKRKSIDITVIEPLYSKYEKPKIGSNSIREEEEVNEFELPEFYLQNLEMATLEQKQPTEEAKFALSRCKLKLCDELSQKCDTEFKVLSFSQVDLSIKDPSKNPEEGAEIDLAMIYAMESGEKKFKLYLKVLNCYNNEVIHVCINKKSFEERKKVSVYKFSKMKVGETKESEMMAF